MDRYVKKRILGTGSYGSAYLVESRNDPSKLFVVKEVVVGHLPIKERDTALQEAAVLREMNHSNIVTCHESFIEGDKLYIVMDYADGGDLSKAIQRRKETARPFSEVEVMNILVQLLLGLRHVHAHKILHRDLKAQNVFLTSSGIVKLGDFGVAKKMDASTDCAMTQIGTPYYLSPEVWNAYPYGKKSDVWSLGVILYELLALDVPFKANSLPILIHKVTSESPPPVPLTYSQHIQVLVYGMLAKEPAQRPSVTQILKSPYVQAYISMQISYTVERGTGGAEADAVVEPRTPMQQPLQTPIQAEAKAVVGRDGRAMMIEHGSPSPFVDRGGGGGRGRGYDGGYDRERQGKAAKEEAADRLRQDFIARQNQARQNRLKAEGDLFGNDEYGAGRGRQMKQQQSPIGQQQQPSSPFQQQRNDLRPPPRIPSVRARGWNHEEDASPKEEAPEYKGQRGGGVGGGGLNDARAQAQLFKQRIQEDLWGAEYGARRAPAPQQDAYSPAKEVKGEDRVIQMRQAGVIEKQRAIALREQELARAHQEIMNEKRRLYEKVQERKRAESDLSEDVMDASSPPQSGHSPSSVVTSPPAAAAEKDVLKSKERAQMKGALSSPGGEVIIQKRRSASKDVEGERNMSSPSDVTSPTATTVLEEKEKARKAADEKRQLELAKAREEAYKARKELQERMEQQKKQQEEQEQEALRRAQEAVEEEAAAVKQRLKMIGEQKENRQKPSVPGPAATPVNQQEDQRQVALPLQTSADNKGGGEENRQKTVGEKQCPSTDSTATTEEPEAPVTKPKRSFFSFFSRKGTNKKSSNNGGNSRPSEISQAQASSSIDGSISAASNSVPTKEAVLQHTGVSSSSSSSSNGGGTEWVINDLEQEWEQLYKRRGERSKSLTEVLEKVNLLVDELKAKTNSDGINRLDGCGSNVDGGYKERRGVGIGKNGNDDPRKELLQLAKGLVSALCIENEEEEDV